MTTEKLKAMEDLAKSLGVVFTVVLLNASYSRNESEKLIIKT